jgi:hypothetical protein
MVVLLYNYTTGMKPAHTNVPLNKTSIRGVLEEGFIAFINRVYRALLD